MWPRAWRHVEFSVDSCTRYTGSNDTAFILKFRFRPALFWTNMRRATSSTSTIYTITLTYVATFSFTLIAMLTIGWWILPRRHDGSGQMEDSYEDNTQRSYKSHAARTNAPFSPEDGQTTILGQGVLIVLIDVNKNIPYAPYIYVRKCVFYMLHSYILGRSTLPAVFASKSIPPRQREKTNASRRRLKRSWWPRKTLG